MLQDATRRQRSSKSMKQTQTRRCKTKVTKHDLLVASTRHHRVHLLKYYLRRPCASSLVKLRMLRPLQTHFLLFEQIFFVLVCIHPGTPRVLPQVLEGVEYDSKVLVFVVCSANAMATWNQQPIPRHHCLARTRSCGHYRYPVQGNRAVRCV